MKRFILLFCVLSITIQSCQNQENELTEAQEKTMIAAARATVEKVFNCSNNMDFVKGLDFYANDSNSYYISDGALLSLDDLKASYKQIGPSVEVLHNTIEAWNTKIISKDAVSFTLPVRLTLKLKGIPEYTGQLVWTAIVQKRANKWMIVQSHESWLNCAEVAAALTPVSDTDN